MSPTGEAHLRLPRQPAEKSYRRVADVPEEARRWICVSDCGSEQKKPGW